MGLGLGGLGVYGGFRGLRGCGCVWRVLGGFWGCLGRRGFGVCECVWGVWGFWVCLEGWKSVGWRLEGCGLVWGDLG